jgi:hypothetical protein
VRARPATLLLAFFAAVSSYETASFAFCHATTCHDCVAPADGCVTEGLPLYWPNSCVTYAVQQDATRWASLDVATRAVDAAFAVWTGSPCAGTGQGPSIGFVNVGPVACNAQEYNDGETTIGGNANIVVFNDYSWNVGDTSMDPESTLALTFVTYDKRSGAILDADILVNGQNALSTATPVPAAAYDLQSLLTHEVGHFIGLAHSPVPCGTTRGCPTMRAVYRKGDDSFRTLEADDVAGVCGTYPPGRPSDPSCVPNFGLSGECGLTVTRDRRGGCTVAAGRPPSNGLVAAIALSVAVSRFSRKRLRRRQPPVSAPPCRSHA